MQESLLRISQLQPLQVGQFGSVEASRQVLIEVLPPILVLHLERFPYDDVATDGIVKINKAVQFATELEIPLGTIFSIVFTVPAKAKNPSWLGRSRNHGARCEEICGAGALQARWGALPPRQVRGQRALYGRCAPPGQRQRWWGSLAAH
jgi:hypothetical protein